ncbi:MAG: phage tail tape measure protein, partial [Sphingopyxis sp.]|nr:phage tail tape measure protein [Sphingopyxis sp.]
EATKRLGDRIKALAPTVNKSAGEVAKGVDSLMSAGMDPETAFGIMPAIGKTATAYRAEVADIAAASFSVIDNMKVPADRLKRALDIMAQAGKDGRFELKAMAAEFPSLTAAAAALGMKGVKGVAKLSAALQVARKGAGSDSEAATNVKNLMQKLQAEDAVKKWKKFNIDIRKEVKKTQDAGGDVFEMVAELTKKTLKGDIAKLGDLYQDAQVQDFLRPLIEHLEFYKKTRDTAESAANVVEADYKIRMETFQSVIDRTSQAFEKLAVSVGESLIPNLSRLADILTPAVSALADWTSANQTLAGNLISAAGAALALAIAFKAVKLAIGAAKLLSLISGGKLLDYLAPRGTPKAPVTASSIVPKPAVPIAPKAGAGLTPGASVPKTASPGSASTATTPRVMTPAEIASAAKGSAALSGSAGLSKVANGLKGGIIGGVVQYAGEALIDKLFDALPKPNMPAGYDPKVEMNKSAWQRAKEIWARATAEADQADKRPMPRPLDPADFERSRRAQDERRRDPEAARGRAMMGRDVMPDGAAAGVE